MHFYSTKGIQPPCFTLSSVSFAEQGATLIQMPGYKDVPAVDTTVFTSH